MSADANPESNSPLSPAAPLPFTKLEGAGNDFVMLEDGWRAHGVDLVDLARRLCDRHRGVGGDGLLTIGEPGMRDVDDGVHLVMGFLNPDGSEAGMCGNGARCLAHHAWRLGYPHPLVFRKGSSIYTARRIAPPAPEQDARGVGHPPTRPASDSDSEWIRIDLPGIVQLQSTTLPGADGARIAATACRPGTEHLVVQAADLEHADTFAPATDASLLRLESDRNRLMSLLQTAGRLRRLRQPFADGANVNMIRPLGGRVIENLTFERGVEGFTLSCGTGAVAAALGWHLAVRSTSALENLEGDEVHIMVLTDGGRLRVGFRDLGDASYTDIHLEGPARTVFRGNFVMDPA